MEDQYKVKDNNNTCNLYLCRWLKLEAGLEVFKALVFSLEARWEELEALVPSLEASG